MERTIIKHYKGKPIYGNPKKHTADKRVRDPYYWRTGDRRRVAIPACPKCLRNLKNGDAHRCADCKAKKV